MIRENKTYISQLEASEQDYIKEILISKGINGNDLKLAMNSKIRDIDYLLNEKE